MHDEHNAIRIGLTYSLIDEPTEWREKVNTISHKKKEGDIVVTLSPCMSLIKGLAPSISSLMPQINASMQDLPNMFEDLLSNSSLSLDSMTTPYQGNSDTEAILQEAHNVLEGRTRNTMPEPPTTSIEKKKQSESMI